MIEEVFRRLKAAGWSLGEFSVCGAGGGSWVVEGSNGENVLRARAGDRAEAWRLAVLQAEAVGMAGRPGRVQSNEE